MIIKPRCTNPKCNKIVNVISHSKIGDKSILRLECGHTLITTDLRSPEEKFLDELTSYEGHKLFDFQKKGVQFAIEANGRALIADEMGLGKTVQGLSVLKLMKLLPAIVVTKARLRDQWEHQAYSWCGEDFSLVRVIREPRIDKPWPKVCGITIVSYDSLPSCAWAKDEEFMKQFKLLIIDETQQIKNRTAKRTVALAEMSQFIPHIIALSGTPIKNNAAEYFSILNILKPERFNNFNRFTYDYVDSFESGPYVKYGGISADARDRFTRETSDFVIRRTMDEVLPDLPKIRRSYSYHELGEKVQQAYQNVLDEFMEAYARGENVSMGSGILAQMARMRYLTGIAKIEPTVEFIEEFLLTTNRKITIFCHHDDAADLLLHKLTKICTDGAFAAPLTLSGRKAEESTDIIEEFKKPERRIMIAKTLAHGEGLNLQFCSDAIILEREWNPANEEQAEARFRRIGSEASSVNITYPVATGTIDEFLAKLVEEKRSFMAATLDGKDYVWQESSVMKELADRLYASGVQQKKKK